MKNKQKSAKENLIKYYNFKECDFYTEEGITYTISKDNYMEKATDVWEEIVLSRKELIEQEDEQ